MANTWEKYGNNKELYFILFILAPKSLQMVTAALILKDIAPWKKIYDELRQHIKKQRHYIANKVCLVKAMIFPVVMYGYES